jgi:hypothetical protein
MPMIHQDSNLSPHPGWYPCPLDDKLLYIPNFTHLLAGWQNAVSSSTQSSPRYVMAGGSGFPVLSMTRFICANFSVCRGLVITTPLLPHRCLTTCYKPYRRCFYQCAMLRLYTLSSQSARVFRNFRRPKYH